MKVEEKAHWGSLEGACRSPGPAPSCVCLCQRGATCSKEHQPRHRSFSSCPQRGGHGPQGSREVSHNLPPPACVLALSPGPQPVRAPVTDTRDWAFSTTEMCFSPSGGQKAKVRGSVVWFARGPALVADATTS